jgi:hypothetical protein
VAAQYLRASDRLRVAPAYAVLAFLLELLSLVTAALEGLLDVEVLVERFLSLLASQFDQSLQFLKLLLLPAQSMLHLGALLRGEVTNECDALTGKDGCGAQRGAGVREV